MDRRWRGAAAVVVLAVVVVIVLIIWRGRRSAGEGEVETDVSVHVGQVARATLHRYVTAYGYVRPEPAGDGKPAAGALIAPYVGGVVVGIDCVEGRPVSAGSVLFRLDSRMAEVDVRKARQEVEFAETAFQRQSELLRSDGTSQRAYLDAQQRLDAARSQLAAAETQLAYLRIKAPLSGTVLRLNARVGEYVDANTVLAEVVDLDRLVVAADVPSREAAGLAIGQTVFLGSDSTASRGALTLVGKDVDPSTGTYRIQASVPAGAGFTPGQFTAIRIVADEHAGVLAVPEEAVVSRAGQGSWVMVVEGERAVRTPVTVGLRDAGLAEISGAGIAEGVTIVTAEAYSLPAETKIRIVGN